MSHEDRIFIINPVGDDPPMEGFFAVRFGRGHVERALSVTKAPHGWVVFLDGFQFAAPSMEWAAAFGSMMDRCGVWGLIGRKLEAAEYERIIRLRHRDSQNGVDLSEPLDLNRQPAPF